MMAVAQIQTSSPTPAHDRPAGPSRGARAIELSVVMPCLNEARTLATCIDKAVHCMARHGIIGEVIIADNGSTDGSRALAEAHGARVVHVKEKGYGAALAGGIAAARGAYIIMGDSDDSYDFSNLMPFVEQLRAGFDLVMGNRFRGGIEPGAMPAMHRYFGNPLLTFLGRTFFKSDCGDFYCGLRGFRKDAYERMRLQSPGMEFALEMLVKSTMHGLRVTEVPTTLKPDGRDRAPHLRRWRDGWRSLRFYLLFSPRWLFYYPGFTLMAIGVVLTTLILTLGQAAAWETHALLLAAAAGVAGYGTVLFAIMAKFLATGTGLHPAHPRLERLLDRATLEAGSVAGAAAALVCMVGLAALYSGWAVDAFDPMHSRSVIRWSIPLVALMTIGLQTFFGSFYLGFLRLMLQRK